MKMVSVSHDTMNGRRNSLRKQRMCVKARYFWIVVILACVRFNWELQGRITSEITAANMQPKPEPEPENQQKKVSLEPPEELELLSEKEMKAVGLSLQDRASRFPSVAERVKLYMQAWYLPPCNESSMVKWRIVFPQKDPTIQTALLSKGPWTQNLTNEFDPRPLDFFWATQKKMQECADDDDMPQQYCKDVIQFIKPHGVQWLYPKLVASEHELSSSSLTPPLIFRFGIRLGDRVRKFQVPYFQKFRPAHGRDAIKQLTQQKSCSHFIDQQNEPVKHWPILWRLNTRRHYKHCDWVAEEDILWKDKKDKAIWRGVFTGGALRIGDEITNDEDCMKMEACRLTYFASAATDTNYEACMKMERCRLVYFANAAADQSLVDAKLTTSRGKIENMTAINGKVNVLGKRMGMKEQLKYKMIISLQGNDVSSGLKWNLLSRSVVLMPPPTLASWAMEDYLEPWVHYVPLDSPLTWEDISAKVRWVLEHDLEAQRIAAAGSLWIQDLLFHEQAKADNAAVDAEILKRLRSHFLFDGTIVSS